MKNLEQLIKHLNEQKYTVSIDQIWTDSLKWGCFIHDEERDGKIAGHSKTYQKTAYLAVKSAAKEANII